MKKFLRNPLVHRMMIVSCVVSTACFAGMLMTGCGAPTWLADAIGLVPILASGATSILTFIGAISGKVVPADVMAEVSTIATDVENGLQNVKTLVQSYKENPSDTLLTDIENGTQAAINDINKFFSVTGLPAAVGQKITAFAQLILTETENLFSLIPVLKNTVTAHASHTVTFPLTKQAFRDLFNQVMTTPTGDTEVDAVLLRMKRI